MISAAAGWGNVPADRRAGLCCDAMHRFDHELRTRLPEHHQYFMDGIEANLAKWISRHASCEQLAHDAAEEISGAGHQSAAALIASQATNIAARIVGLTEGFIDLANLDNTYAAPPVVRALYETACVPCYMARNIIPRLRKGRTNDVRRLTFRLGLGTGPGAGYGHIRPIGIPQLNSATNQWVANYLRESGGDAVSVEKIAQMIYGPLSDRSHPNFGATHGGSSLQPGGMPDYLLRPTFDEGNIDELLSATSFMLLVGGEALDSVVAAIKQYTMLFPPGDPEWHDDDLFKPGEASVKRSATEGV